MGLDLGITDLLSAGAVLLLLLVLVLVKRLRASLLGSMRAIAGALRSDEGAPGTGAEPSLPSRPAASRPAVSRRLSLAEAVTSVLARDLREALWEDSSGADGARLREAAERAASRAEELARIATGGRMLEERVSLGLVWPRVEHRMRIRREPSHHVNVQLPADLPPVCGSAEGWAELLAELIDNSLQSMPGGGVVTCRAGLDDRDGWVAVTVEDRGSGISPRLLPHVFEPYLTSHESSDGLGLPIVAALAESFGGEVSIASKPGEGTRVDVRVPIAPSRPGEEALRASGEVVVADDDQSMRRAIVRLLATFGLRSVEADSGTLARSLLLTEPRRFGLAILDVVMPGTPVDEVVTAIRGKRPDLPVLLVSGYDTMRMVDSVLELGGVRFLRKPFTREELEQALLDLNPRASVDAGESLDGPRA